MWLEKWWWPEHDKTENIFGGNVIKALEKFDEDSIYKKVFQTKKPLSSKKR